ncbi:MAG: translation initiation factor IF-2 [Flavobacteriales bacterium]|nr:translation initiation factor IF-2 [Flavobacteriales bacterium]MDG1934322.1 translation initiation factor IF-2 [Flavobacteriales bacterium]MDG2086793.1 translation initiation factor IF-2 [Flavobacteriales bacterium]
MSNKETVRLNKLVKEFNVSIDRIFSFLESKGIKDLKPNSKVSYDIYMDLLGEFDSEKKAKLSAELLAKEKELAKAEEIIKQQEAEEKAKLEAEEKAKLEAEEKTKQEIKKDEVKNTPKIVGKLDVTSKEKSQQTKNEDSELIKATAGKLKGVTTTGQKIDLTKFKKPEKIEKKKRVRIVKEKVDPRKFRKPKTVKKETIEISPEEAQKRVRETLAKLQSGKKSSVKNRRDKRQAHRDSAAEETSQKVASNKTIKIAEFATASELASMMDVSVTDIVTTCMGLGMMVSINQRIDAETIQMLAEDFGYKVEFVGADVQESIEEIIDSDEELESRAPIITIMGHVDHGKTSLMDYIRETNVIAGESGGITQHIGAYEVTLENGKRISFLDTPGHQAFTAMRARGAKVTDIVVVVVAADDRVMPQTKEAISHAQAAGVPIIFAINKIDRPTSDPEKIKGELAEMNLLVEDWGGKYQSQDISAKVGTGVTEILEKILLESEMLDLKANPNRLAQGTVIEASLDKGKGYLSTILVQTGTLKVGDYVLAGSFSGKVKALLNERGESRVDAGPSTPVVLLGLDGAPTAGDEFHVMDSEQEAKKIATRRSQLQREQSVRTQKHITLDEIGRRIALGGFQEINVIVKGDVDGSIEALSDSLQQLSTDEIKVNIIQKAVGQISESDVMLAAASDAIIIGFQVRPSLQARKLAENEQIDIRLYSIIYNAIEELKQAMEGMLSPDVEEKIVCNIEIRDVFKISKVGTIAGCMVLDGSLNKNTGVRIIRDGVVVYTGKLSSLKRFKDDVNEVKKGFECGLSIANYNDIKVGDIIEGYTEVEVKRTLS